MKFAGKVVLVTGAGGFIGSHLVEHLVRLNAKVRAFIHYNSIGSWGWLDTLPDETKRGIEVTVGDIRDSSSIQEAVQGTSAVFHLAALIGIPYSYRSPESYVSTNIYGTLNILQAAKAFQVERILVTSTSEVYGTAQYVPIDEQHPRQGQSPYSASKIGADSLAESFYLSYGLPVVIARPFNTYGPRQSSRAIIPTIITQLLSGSISIRLGNLSPTRDLNYVEDTCQGLLAACSCDDAVGQVLNISSEKEISIGDLAQEIIRQINPRAKIEADAQRFRPEKSEVRRLLGSSEKLRRLTEWSPTTDLASGIQKTIAWFRESSSLRMYRSDIYNV